MNFVPSFNFISEYYQELKRRKNLLEKWDVDYIRSKLAVLNKLHFVIMLMDMA